MHNTINMAEKGLANPFSVLSVRNDAMLIVIHVINCVLEVWESRFFFFERKYPLKLIFVTFWQNLRKTLTIINILVGTLIFQENAFKNRYVHTVLLVPVFTESCHLIEKKVLSLAVITNVCIDGDSYYSS